MGNSHSGCAASVSKFYRPGAWIEGSAESQLDHVATWRGMSQIAAFPDLHPGRHGPVGAAFLADRIYPQLIGPDIGCGMALFQLDLPRRKLKLDKAARRLRDIEKHPLETLPMPHLALPPDGLGTLGGGNHFCEIQAVSQVYADGCDLQTGDLTLLVHTGSRGHGAAVFNGLTETWTAGFEPHSDAGKSYLSLHNAAQDWAGINRSIIAQNAAVALRCSARLICDAPHNHLEETSDGWLHRKGAARADRGFAPLAGSRESASYLVSVPETDAPSLCSISHGAGRRYDRASMHGRVARTKSAIAAMQYPNGAARVICEDRNLLVEESAVAYKNVGAVLADLKHFGLAQPVARLEPLITYKKVRRPDHA